MLDEPEEETLIPFLLISIMFPRGNNGGGPSNPFLLNLCHAAMGESQKTKMAAQIKGRRKLPMIKLKECMDGRNSMVLVLNEKI